MKLKIEFIAISIILFLDLGTCLSLFKIKIAYAQSNKTKHYQNSSD
jgi:hypothetical protein